jgi:hypothetical protein
MKRFLAAFLSTALLISSIPFAFAVTETMEVEFVVRNGSTSFVEDAEVYIYVFNEDEEVYEQYNTEPYITSGAGRTQDALLPLDVTFYGIGMKDGDIFAGSGFSYANIWQTHEDGSITNLQTDSHVPMVMFIFTRMRHVCSRC